LARCCIQEIEKHFLKYKNKTMKKNSSLLSPLSQKSLINLTTEVKEVLAKEDKKTERPGLTIVDLWNIQRRQKARLQRRYF